jgi:indolepyruvate ferredoxin oxidoreductase
MAYKDEYEVARLYTDGRFRKMLRIEFESVSRVKLHFAPPLLARGHSRTGRPRKFALGTWVFLLLRVLAVMRGLREGPFDIFRMLPERKLERSLRDAYLAAIHRMTRTLSQERLASSTELAGAPLNVRGFGAVKHEAAKTLLARLAA